MNTVPAQQHEGKAARVIIAILIVVISSGAGFWAGLMLGGWRELRTVSALRSTPIDLLSLTDRVTASDSEFLLIGDARVARWSPAPELRSSTFDLVGSAGMTAVQLELAMEFIAPRLAGKTIVVQIGINDLKAIGYMDRDPEAIVSETKRSLAAIHRTLKRNDVRVLVSTIIPPGPVGFARRPIWDDRIRDAVASVNEALVSGHLVAVEDVVDFGSLLGSTHKTDSVFCADTLHLNRSGYELLDACLIERLLKLTG